MKSNPKNLYKHITKFIFNYSGQFLWILLSVSLFFDAAILSPATIFFTISKYKVIFIVILNLFLLGVLILKVKSNLNKRLAISPVVIPLLLFVLIRISFLDYIPTWDSSEYFDALQRSVLNFNFSLQSFLVGFEWLRHPTHGYAFISSILQFLDPSNTKLIQITQIFLGSVGIFSYYHLCRYFFGKNKETINLLLTLLYGIHPSYLATSISFTPDFGVIVFLTATISAYLNKKLILTFFCALLLVFTKETGVLALLAFTVMLTFFAFMKRSIKENFKNLLILYLPLILIIIYTKFLITSPWSPDSNDTYQIGDLCRFCFAIKSFNIYEYLKVFFVLNFNWIYSTVILLAIAKALISAKTKNIKFHFSEKNIFALSIISSSLAIIIFFLFYIIYVYVRYSIPYYLGFSLIFALSLNYLITKKAIKMLFLILFSILMLIQNFKTIDPLSRYLFGTYHSMNQTLLTIGTEYLGDGLIYNTQFANIQRLLSKIITAYELNGQSNVYIEPYLWGNFKTGWGLFKDAQPKIYYSIHDYNKLPEEFYYINFPFLEYSNMELKKLELGFRAPLIPDGQILALLSKNYMIVSEEIFNHSSYSVRVLKLRKINF